MIDTVRLSIQIDDISSLIHLPLKPYSISQLSFTSGYAATHLQTSLSYTKLGEYMPKLSVVKRFNNRSVVFEMVLEFSAPKLLFGNNFQELQDDDFDRLLNTLQQKIRKLTSITLELEQLRSAKVSRWDVSKNIVFDDFTSCQTILTTLAKLDVDRTYDLVTRDYRDGYLLRLHTNSIDIALYDKMADLRTAMKSEKRAYEVDSLISLGLFDSSLPSTPIEILRFEIRVTGRAAIKRTFTANDQWIFESMFRSNLSQTLLMKHWTKLMNSVSMLALDQHKPYELLQNYTADNPNASPQAAMSAVLGLLIADQQGISAFRNLLDSRFGTHIWPRYKHNLRSPDAHRYKHFEHISRTLKVFRPIRSLDDISD